MLPLTILRPPQGRPPREVRLVAQAAEALEVGEFELFRAAYRAWYGDEPETKRLERDFAGYLKAQRLPAYVRHFARQVVAEAETGRPAERPELDGLKRRERLVEPGAWAVAALVAAAFLLYLLVLA
jgi:hypothetical protein